MCIPILSSKINYCTPGSCWILLAAVLIQVKRSLAQKVVMFVKLYFFQWEFKIWHQNIFFVHIAAAGSYPDLPKNLSSMSNYMFFGIVIKNKFLYIWQLLDPAGSHPHPGI